MITVEVLLARIERKRCTTALRGVCAEHRIHVDDLLLGRGNLRAWDARRALYEALRAEGLSLKEIAWCVGKDHTSIMEGLRPRGWRRLGMPALTTVRLAGPPVRIRVAV